MVTKVMSRVASRAKPTKTQAYDLTAPSLLPAR